ncbi:MAG: TRAP transporter small permease [SAR324 cluster bacterium]|nr:TRAP transporter small permease [SAR324 cluster bacterium]
MIRLIDQLSEWTGKLAAWMFFAVGFFVTYEVFMRHFFTMPTIWVDEVSRIFQIWATFLAGGFALKHRQLIVIDVAFRDKDSLARKCTETFAILVILIFSLVVVWYGFELWYKALVKGHTTDTFLAPPKWLTHGSVWFGFALISLQTFVEFIKIWRKSSTKNNLNKGKL